MKFYPYKRGEGKNSFSHAQGGGGGHKKFSACSLVILKGGRGSKRFHILKWGGGRKVLP